MAGADMTKYYVTHPGPKRRHNLIISATAFVLSAVVTLIFIVTEFTNCAWLIVVAGCGRCGSSRGRVPSLSSAPSWMTRVP